MTLKQRPYSSVGGNKFDKGIDIALNNPYNVKCRPKIVLIMILI